MSNEWMPIETAPKDGTLVDLWCRAPGIFTRQGRIPECWFSGECWWRHDDSSFGDDQCRSRVHNATHWMPLPSPPGRLEERADQIRNLCQASASDCAVSSSAQAPLQSSARCSALEEALTPSAGTKYAYSSEFFVTHIEYDGDDNEHHIRIDVPWTVIKQIMRAILDRAKYMSQLEERADPASDDAAQQAQSQPDTKDHP